MRVTLQVTEGPHQGQTYSFSGHDTFLVGRSSRAHLRLPAKDLYFSRVHFLIEINPPHCRLLDMGSRNGTYVNGERVDVIDLKDGDQVKAGHTVFHLAIHRDAPTPNQTPTIDHPVHASTVPPSSADTHSPTPPSFALGTLDEGGPSATPRPGAISFGALPTIAPSGEMAAPAQAAVKPAAAPATQGVAAPSGPPCVLCGSPRAAGATRAGTSAVIEDRLCADCVRRMQSLAQTVPGYRVLREIGRGGMGVVHLAARERDGKFVALKTIIPAVEASAVEVQKFLREAEILRQLDHPNIVRFLEINTAHGQLWFAMDFVPGIDAARLLKKHGPLTVPRAVGLVCQLLKALEYAHARRYVHRDIKPANLLVSKRDGREVALLADFGLARVYQASQLSGLTMTGSMGGTPMFMPPEQITHYRQAQPTVDQYASAMTLYNLLTGQFGYDMPENFKQWIAMILEEEPRPIRDRRGDIPQGLADAIHKALTKDPAARFSDVQEFRHALEPFAS